MGNWVLSRCDGGDHLIRQGYLPIVFADLDRDEHLKMVGLAHDGNPVELCTHVVQSQLEMLLRDQDIQNKTTQYWFTRGHFSGEAVANLTGNRLNLAMLRQKASDLG